MTTTLRVLMLGAALSLSACAAVSTTAPMERPVMRWDFHPEASNWTLATMGALQTHGAVLAEVVPDDIETWCPDYANNTLEERQAFWAGLFSALAKHESTWNETASGGGGRWIGLLQIAPDTARAYGCNARSAAELRDGQDNLSCGVRIAAAQVARDNLVAGNGTKGVGRDWAPFRSAQKRTEMAVWTRSQSYCQ